MTKTPYQDLPFNPAEATRTLDQVNEAHWTSIEDAIERMISVNGACRMLDMGCGNSPLTYELLQMFPNLTAVGVDLYTDLERKFQRPADDRTEFRVADGAQVPADAEEFDIIVATYGPSRYGSELTMPKRSYITEIGRLLNSHGQARIRPEHSYLGVFGIAWCLSYEKADEHLKIKAAHYLQLQEKGFSLSFREEPHRAIVTGPAYL